MTPARLLLPILILSTLPVRAHAAPVPELIVPDSGGPGLVLQVRRTWTAGLGVEDIAILGAELPLGPTGRRRRGGVALAAEPEPAEAPRSGSAPPPVEVRIELSPELVRETLRVAARTAGNPRSRSRLASLQSRARAAGALPEVRVRGGRTTDESLRLTPTDADPDRYTQAGASTLFVDLQVRWRWDRLLFDGAELQVERLRQQQASAERELTRVVLETLFVWQRALVRARDERLPSDERVDAELDAYEAELRLDVLTGGWFTGEGRRNRTTK